MSFIPLHYPLQLYNRFQFFVLEAHTDTKELIIECHLLYQFRLKHKDNVPVCGIWLPGTLIRQYQPLL